MANLKTKKSRIEEDIDVQENISHPLIEKLDVIDDLLTRREEVASVLSEIDNYTKYLSSPDVLDAVKKDKESMESIIKPARSKISKMISEHKKGVLKGEKGGQIKTGLKTAKNKLGSLIGIAEEPDFQVISSEKPSATTSKIQATPKSATKRGKIEIMETIRPLDEMGVNGVSKLITRIEKELRDQKIMGTPEKKLVDLEQQLKEVREYFEKRFKPF